MDILGHGSCSRKMLSPKSRSRSILAVMQGAVQRGSLDTLALRHLGDMQRAMFRSFDDAKKKAPAILFIDEVDSFTDRDREQSHNASYVRQACWFSFWGRNSQTPTQFHPPPS
ncbi:AAA family ATPase [Rhizobium ruizarguesonis]|nr:AAA family ATPase [Rhizobium ruizarguesonis]TAU52497.1 AAA family ATPase [Rhizobium leguminosarum]TAW66010.1 AAA family ATPase [Rhizobium ruizarguesonis]